MDDNGVNETTTTKSEEVPFRADSIGLNTGDAEVQPDESSTIEKEIGTSAEVTPSTGDPSRISVSFTSPSNPLDVEDENANGGFSAVTQEVHDDSISSIAQQQPKSRSPTPDFSQALRNSAPQAHTSDTEAVSGEQRDQTLVHPENGPVTANVEEGSHNKQEEKEAVTNDEEEDDYEPPAPLSPQNVPLEPNVPASRPSSSDPVRQPSSQNDYAPVADVPDTSDNVPSDAQSVKPLTDSEIPKNAATSIDVPSAPTLEGPPAASTAALVSPTEDYPSSHNFIEVLENRVEKDPIGDAEAWLELIDEYRNMHKLDEARSTYDRFFNYFPTASAQWVAYAQLEQENDELFRLEQIFNKSLLSVPSVRLWNLYLDYIRRRNDLTTDTTGDARKIVASAYDFALQAIGIDKDAGQIWLDYIKFVRGGPGNLGGTTWQDQQKMDIVRAAYQKAICVPTAAVIPIFKEYDQFELSLNKANGRKYIQDQSRAYVTARSSYTSLQNITKDLNRMSLPRLPPLPGCEGYDHFAKQVSIWKQWIKWEIDDPLILKGDDPALYKSRIIFVYRQAMMCLRFVPEIWFDGANFCYEHDMAAEGDDFLVKGIEANPESYLLAAKRADRLEIITDHESDPVRRGSIVKEPYDRLLDALYDLVKKARDEEASHIALVEERLAKTEGDSAVPDTQADDDDEELEEAREKEIAKKNEIDEVKKSFADRLGQLSKLVSYVWIALMRAMRRIQGKGKPGEMAGSRQVFADARRRGRITSDVYIASALMEHYCYQDPAATKIFERGSKLFPEDEIFAIEYLKHLIDINDITNARAVFETSTRRLTATPANIPKSRILFAFMHHHETRYGDMVQIMNIENKMKELFPDDPVLNTFTARFTSATFNPISVQLVLSPTQSRPPEPHVTQVAPVPRYQEPAMAESVSKRSHTDEYEEDFLTNRPRKVARGDSPMRGPPSGSARRKNAREQRQERQDRQEQQQQQQAVTNLEVPPPLPKAINYLLSIIPPAASYHSVRFSPARMVSLINQIDMPSNSNVHQSYNGSYY